MTPLIKTPRITNAKARAYVQEKQPFTGSHLYAKWLRISGREMYVVYSYGPAWPLFMYDKSVGVWFENAERCSVTTSRHRTQAHPHVPTIVCDTATIRDAIHVGVNAVLLRGEEVA